MCNNNCMMSLIQKPCPRDVFDCRRCLVKMKNAGKTWKVWFDDELSIATRGTIEPFESKLYWDQTQGGFMSFVNTPDEVTAADIRCISGIWGRRYLDQEGLPFLVFETPPNTLLEDVFQIRAGLYFEKKWWLWVRLDSVTFGTIGVGGDTLQYNFTAEAHYSTDEDDCFVNDRATFNLAESAGTVVTNDPDYEPVTVDYSFPATVSFQHVANDGFND